MNDNSYFPDLYLSTISIIGMGYVGLPLAIEFSKIKKDNDKTINHKVIGFDLNKKRIEELKNNYDLTNEVSEEELKNSSNLFLTCDQKFLIKSDIFIVTVPTPVDKANVPDLSALNNASELIGKVFAERKFFIKNNNLKETTPIVIFESTVYPGATRENCIPIIERFSEFKNNKDFFFGYSPERINPGDKTKKLTLIKKVTSGSNEFAADWIDKLYKQIIIAGTYKTKSIEIAEAAKIIENVQRDINIALMNELAIIFSKLNLDTFDILEAAKTKWNFLPFEPGLVGGHCIGVDPYYLTYKAKLLGYYPEIVSSGRRLNEHMSDWISERIIINISKRNFILNQSSLLCLGLTFKSNCPDIRNSKVINLIKKLLNFKIKIDVVDPLVNEKEIEEKFQIKVSNKIPSNKKYTCVLLAVDHIYFKNLDSKNWQNMLSKNGLLFDLKNIIPRDLNPVRL